MPAKDILIITSYFPPETGAASNRIFALAYQLRKHYYSVSVVSPLPNYPHGRVFKNYKNRFKFKEQYKSISVIRLFTIASKSSHKFIRLFCILSYALVLFFYLLFSKTPKYFIIQCSPLFVGYFAVLAGKIRGKSIILNVSDLWPLAGLEMGILAKGFYYNLLEKLEIFIYKNSHKIIGQSEEILKHIDKRLSGHCKSLFLYRNYPDFEVKTISKKSTKREFKFVYAGLIGVAQGIEEICNSVKFPDGSSFHIYGDGPMADEVKAICSRNDRIFYHGILSRKDLHKKLEAYDATIVALKNRIYGSVPSKIFEYSKLGLPVLFFSDGEGADLVEGLGLGISQRNVDYARLEQMIQKIVRNEIQLPSKDKVLKQSNLHFNIEKQFEDFKKCCLD